MKKDLGGGCHPAMRPGDGYSCSISMKGHEEIKPLPPTHFTTNTETQRQEILACLLISPLSTLQARSELDIMHPAARVQELREQGYPIFTHWTRENGHRVAKYVLLAGEQS